MEAPKVVGYRQAVFAAERSYCRQGRRLAAFHTAWLQRKGTGIIALELAEFGEGGTPGISANHPRLPGHAPNTVWTSFAPNPAGPMFGGCGILVEMVQMESAQGLEEKVLTLSRPGLAFCPLSAAAPCPDFLQRFFST
jgi:hypothetical protein